MEQETIQQQKKVSQINKIKEYMQGKENIKAKDIKQSLPEIKNPAVLLSQGVKYGFFEKQVRGYKLK